MFERCALTLVDRKKARDLQRKVSKVGSAGKKKDKGRDCEDNALEIDAIFLEVFVLATELNLFGEGPPCHMDSRRNSKNRGESCDQQKKRFSCEYLPYEFSTFYAPKGQQVHLNKNLLKLVSIGEGRLRDYFEVYLKKGDLNCTYRGKDAEGYVSLKKLPTFAKDIQDDINCKKERCHSIDYKVLKTHTNEELKQEIKCLNGIFRGLNCNGEMEKVSTSKDENIGILISLRRILKRNSDAWKDYKEQQIRNIESPNDEEGLSNEVVADILANELENVFFNLGEYRNNATATKNFVFNATKYRIGAADHNLFDNDNGNEGGEDVEIQMTDDEDYIGDRNIAPNL